MHRSSVFAIQTKGWTGSSTWIESFRLDYSLDCTTFISLLNDNGTTQVRTILICLHYRAGHKIFSFIKFHFVYTSKHGKITRMRLTPVSPVYTISALVLIRWFLLKYLFWWIFVIFMCENSASADRALPKPRQCSSLVFYYLTFYVWAFLFQMYK